MVQIVAFVIVVIIGLINSEKIEVDKSNQALESQFDNVQNAKEHDAFKTVSESELEFYAEGRANAVPESELAMDADIAASLARGLGEGASKIGLSADNERVIFVAQFQFSPNEISTLKTAIEHGNLELRHALHKMPTYPVIAIQPVIFDDPNDPFWLETFPNIGGQDKAVLQCIRQIGQMGLCFHFCDKRGNLIFRAGYAGSWVGNLGQDIVAAELHLESISHSTRNYAAAVQQYIRENP